MIFTCGGTAGHVNPALALAGLLRERRPDSRVLFVGAHRGIEKKLIEDAGWPFRAVEVPYKMRKLIFTVIILICGELFFSVGKDII